MHSNETQSVKTNLRPIGDNIIGLIIETEKKSSGIILVNEESDRTSNTLEVLRVGEGRTTGDSFIPVAITPGQRVIIPKYAGTTLQDGDSSFVIFKEQDVIAVVE